MTDQPPAAAEESAPKPELVRVASKLASVGVLSTSHLCRFFASFFRVCLVFVAFSGARDESARERRTKKEKEPRGWLAARWLGQGEGTTPSDTLFEAAAGQRLLVAITSSLLGEENKTELWHAPTCRDKEV